MVSDQKALISVVMPTYNTDVEMLSTAVDSILSQSYENFEFIIVDDCTDDAASLGYLNCITDKRVKIIRNAENMGITKSLNIGFSTASGKYIARMDSDDISLPERLERQVEFMENNPSVIVCGSWVRVFGDRDYEEKRVIPSHEYLRCSMLFGNLYGLCHPTAMFRAETIKKYGIAYDEQLPTAQDYGIWTECVRYGEIVNLPEILLNYRVHTAQVSVKKREIQQKCTMYTQRKQLSMLFDEVDDDKAERHYLVCSDHYLTKDTVLLFKQFITVNNKKNIYNKKIFSTCVWDILGEKAVNSASTVRSFKEITGLLVISPLRLHFKIFKKMVSRVFK